MDILNMWESTGRRESVENYKSSLSWGSRCRVVWEHTCFLQFQNIPQTVSKSALFHSVPFSGELVCIGKETRAQCPEGQHPAGS